jgi:hypothetical protein
MWDSTRFALGIFASAIVAGCGGANSSVPAVSADAAAFAHHKTFTYVGRAQKFAVPKGVNQIEVDALGANGGSFAYGGFQTGPGGYGGRVVATLNVTPQEQLLVYVGGPGSGSIGGFNGGGAGGAGEVSNEEIEGAGGGGASDVRTSYPLGNRIVIAGGGGGGGGIYTKRLGSNFGGKGGGLIGGSGGSSSKCRKYGVCGQGGGGGTQSAGGIGGDAGSGWCKDDNEFCGGDGMIGAGGEGGTGIQYLASGGGGGGGGGYYGGGGGGAGAYNYPPSGFPGPGGGGAGGSSYVEPSASGVKMWQGWKATQRVIVIYW